MSAAVFYLAQKSERIQMFSIKSKTLYGEAHVICKIMNAIKKSS